MLRLGKKLRSFGARTLDLPKDVIFDLPRITMIGNMQLYVENYRGVRKFTEHKLTLKLSVGSLEISGERLVIRAILQEEVFVEGTIIQVRYLPDD